MVFVDKNDSVARIQFGILALMLAILAACGSPAREPRPPDYWPTEGWRTAPPEAHGIDPERLAMAVDGVESELPFLDSLIVIRDGYIVQEQWRGIGINFWISKNRCLSCCQIISMKATMQINGISRSGTY